MYNESSKIYRCVQNVLDAYYRHEAYTQLIFCDYSTPKGEDFSVYKEIKARLVEKGVPEKEIAFIHSYNTEFLSPRCNLRCSFAKRLLS